MLDLVSVGSHVILTRPGRSIAKEMSSFAIQLYANCQRVRVHRLRRRYAQTAGEVGLAQDPLAILRIVVIEDVRGPGPLVEDPDGSVNAMAHACAAFNNGDPSWLTITDFRGRHRADLRIHGS